MGKAVQVRFHIAGCAEKLETKIDQALGNDSHLRVLDISA